MKRQFPGENVCRRTNSKQLYQIHSILFGGSANATVSLSLKHSLLRKGIVEISRDSRFPSLIFVLPSRFVSFHQHSQYYTVSSEDKQRHAELFLTARRSLLKELFCCLDRTNSGLLDSRRRPTSAQKKSCLCRDPEFVFDIRENLCLCRRLSGDLTSIEVPFLRNEICKVITRTNRE